MSCALNKGRSFLLTAGFFYLQLVFVASGQLAWSFLITVEIRFGLSCLRSKVGLVFFTCGLPPAPAGN